MHPHSKVLSKPLCYTLGWKGRLEHGRIYQWKMDHHNSSTVFQMGVSERTFTLDGRPECNCCETDVLPRGQLRRSEPSWNMPTWGM